MGRDWPWYYTLYVGGVRIMSLLTKPVLQRGEGYEYEFMVVCPWLSRYSSYQVLLSNGVGGQS